MFKIKRAYSIAGMGVLLIIGATIFITDRNFSSPPIQQPVEQSPVQAGGGTNQTYRETTQTAEPIKQQRNPSLAGSPSSSMRDGCGATKQLFGASPVALDKISTIIPLGNFEPHSHIAPTTQIYIRYLHDKNIPVLTTLYAPADMTVTQIWLFDNNSAPVPFNSYRIDFTLCNGVNGYFIHAITLNDALMSAFHTPYDFSQTSDVGLAKQDHMYRKNVSVALKAGEVLGTAGGKSIYPDALDFGLSDDRVPAGVVANPVRWDDHDLHYVCPLDYFPSAVTSALYDKLGDFDGRLLSIDSPKCGEVYQDKPGTAQGLWIAKTSLNPGIFDTPNLFTLGHSSIDHTRGVFVMGNVLQQLGFDNNSLYEFSPKATGKVNIDFNKVTPDGNIYCYETMNDRHNQSMAALIQLRDDHTLRVGKLDSDTCGSGPWQFSKYSDFTR